MTQMQPFSLVAVLVMALVGALSSTPSPVTYRVKAAESRFAVEVGRSGLFKALGHDHLIVVERFTGEVDFVPSTPQSSRFSLDVDAASLKVEDDEVSDEDREKIQSDMDAKALDLPTHPHIVFESTRVEVDKADAATFQLRVSGTLSLRGVEKPLVIPLTLTTNGDRLTATGEFVLRSDAWGVPQISAVGGAVKTKEDLHLTFQITAEKN